MTQKLRATHEAGGKEGKQRYGSNKE